MFTIIRQEHDIVILFYSNSCMLTKKKLIGRPNAAIDKKIYFDSAFGFETVYIWQPLNHPKSA